MSKHGVTIKKWTLTDELGRALPGYAAECVRLAQLSSHPADKALLVEMAENWIRSAEARADTSDIDRDEC